jgi:hypothetical protein
MASTQARVYTVVDTPTAPWQGVAPPGDRAVWTDVLDVACVWAAGQTNAAAAATHITTSLNGLAGSEYQAMGASVYCNPNSSFQCTQFLATLGLEAGVIVNCTDCATVVTTFANALGADLFAGRMEDRSANPQQFDCNWIIVIGTQPWAPPFPDPSGQGKYGYHEVAVPGNAPGLSLPVYDACLKVDTGPNPWVWPGQGHVAGPQVGMPWTLLPVPVLPIPAPFNLQSYRERLAADTMNGIGRCEWSGAGPGTGGGRRWPQ